jgi:hypothetical protein
MSRPGTVGRSVLVAFVLMLLVALSPRVRAAVMIPLTVQETIYQGGVSGITRNADPVTVGIPLPDDPSTGVSDVSQLSLTGASAGQFRVLGRWPSGRLKWVLVDTLASLSGGGTSTSIALTTGGGNFGGSNLATDNGSTITVATGTATFTIRKANFNGFHQVVVGGTTVVAPGASTGLVVLGPTAGNTTCGSGTCTTVYASSNDAGSTCSIEENGPVRAALKCTGSHKNGSGNEYMKFTVRMHFYRGLSRVKATTTLRNADYGTSGSFESAYKGHQGYEWRLSPTLTGTPTYQIAKDGGAIESGTLASGTDDIYVYQGASDWMKHEHWGCCGTIAYTNDSGWSLVKNGSNLDTGTRAEYPAGWADIRGASNGAGVSIGVYQFAAYWSKSLEFNDAGTDTRIGIWPRQNSIPYYQAWPQWSTHDLYFNFHDAALSSPGNEFLKFQHYLLGRASRAHYNTAGVFPYPLVDPSVEDAFFATTHSGANPSSAHNFGPIQDAFPAGGQLAGNGLKVYRVKDWRQGGESNQQEFRWSWLLNFIQRGTTGRYVNAAHFYRFLTDDAAPHSDGFNWRDKPGMDSFGRPGTISSLNSGLAFTSWYDEEHYHWYGMPDYYFMSGDETVKDAILDGYADWHLNTTAQQAGNYPGTSNSRSVGVTLLSAARVGTFLRAIGQTSEADTVLNNAAALYNFAIVPVLCTNAEQSSQGCTTGATLSEPLKWETDWKNFGVSRTRGIVWKGGGASTWCGVDRLPAYYRFYSTWASGAFNVLGLWELAQAKGTGWNEYWRALDLAYGIIQGANDEFWFEQGNGRWDQDGWRSGTAFDRPGNCTVSPETGSPAFDQQYFVPQPILSHWMLYYVKHQIDGSTDWVSDVRKSLLKSVNYTGSGTADFYGYQIGAVIHAATTGSARTLQTRPITSFADNGGGSYTIGWTVPSGAQSYRIKWGAKQLVDWIGFNPSTNTFRGNPNTTMPWFAATNVPAPAPAAAGATQSLTISTGRSGLSAANFSVKAYVGGGGGSSSPGTAANLVLVSGNNQIASAGSALSAPLTVKATDSSGNGVAGVSVTFTAGVGGGAVTTPVMSTDSSGLASTLFTLGPAAGTNTVLASAASLGGSPVTFTALANTSSDQIALAPNTWVNVTPSYQGAPDGGYLAPFSYNSMGVYDPTSKRTISFERWYDPIRSMSIYANSLVAYDPGTNTATVLKVSNWLEGNRPLPANAMDPTPIDRHPMGGLALDRSAGTIYLVNGANQSGRAYYPDHPNDTWKFSLQTRSWSKVADAIADPSTPHPPSDVASYSGMVYDPPTGKLVYFVVTSTNGTRTWLFDPASNRWSMAPADPSSTNVYIAVAGIAYDSRRNLVLAYGGGHNSASSSARLWSYSISQNRWTALRDAPIAADAAEFAYDAVHDVFLALVNQSTLIYNPRTNTWSYLAATIDRGRIPNRQNVTFNPAHNVFVFQGGSWDNSVWSLFRYDDAASPALRIPTGPTNLRIVR